MKVEKTKKEERLIIRSDDGPSDIMMGWLFILALAFVIVLVEIAEGEFTGLFLVGVIITLMVLVNLLMMWISTGIK